MSPVDSWNRNDPDTPTVRVAIEPGECPLPDARNLALAILAASSWKE